MYFLWLGDRSSNWRLFFHQPFKIKTIEWYEKLITIIFDGQIWYLDRYVLSGHSHSWLLFLFRLFLLLPLCLALISKILNLLVKTILFYKIEENPYLYLLDSGYQLMIWIWSHPFSDGGISNRIERPAMGQLTWYKISNKNCEINLCFFSS